MMAEKSPKCLHQSSGAGEDGVRKIESSAKTNNPVLPEEFGCRANSKGIVSQWVAGCVTRGLHRPENHQNVRRCVDTGRWNSGSWDERGEINGNHGNLPGSHGRE